jgi:Phage portal protein
MTFWSRLFGDHQGVTPNANPPSTPPSVGGADYSPGDPHGLVVDIPETFSRGMPGISPSPWDGWPADWLTPSWQAGLGKLVDTAWFCLDLNSSVLSTMPNYRLQGGEVQDPLGWQINPDPDIYSSWEEFAKQLFWDYQMGEVFVLPTSLYFDGSPRTFRVIPPWMINVEMGIGRREYRLGSLDVTDSILHIRYRSTTETPHGQGPLESSGARLTASELLDKYVADFIETGGIPLYWLEVDKPLTLNQAEKLLENWMISRKRNLARPAVASGGAKLKAAERINMADIAFVELSKFTESRIAIKLGVHPFIAGLPSGGDSMTYSNVSQIFDYHDRAFLKPRGTTVMKALSGWALPRGQSVELNRDEYTRPPLDARAKAYSQLAAIEQNGEAALRVDEIRSMERFTGSASAAALTGDVTGD